MKKEIIGNATLYLGNCLDVLPTLDLVDSVVTDPPYGIGMMGRDWDHGVPGVKYWEAIMAAMKPGAFLLAFGGTRTYHRLTCAIEDAGFEIRDCIMWVYGSGMPKSYNISKAIDKVSGVDREIVGTRDRRGRYDGANRSSDAGNGKSQCDGRDADVDITLPTTPEAQQWDGWGTALKPAWEPIIVARKPLEGNVASNVLKHGTGGLNIDASRIAIDPEADKSQLRTLNRSQRNGDSLSNDFGMNSNGGDNPQAVQPQGRYPANLIHDGSEEVVELFPITKSGTMKAGTPRPREHGSTYSPMAGEASLVDTYGDMGSAARFFYCAKASKTDRNEGLEDLPDSILARSCQAVAEAKRGNTVESSGGAFNKARVVKNHHPTVKPTALMEYLIRLVTPPGGTTLDPYVGSGSSPKAGIRSGFKCIGIDDDSELGSFDIACARVRHAHHQATMPRQESLIFNSEEKNNERFRNSIA